MLTQCRIKETRPCVWGIVVYSPQAPSPTQCRPQADVAQMHQQVFLGVKSRVVQPYMRVHSPGDTLTTQDVFLRSSPLQIAVRTLTHAAGPR